VGRSTAAVAEQSIQPDVIELSLDDTPVQPPKGPVRGRARTVNLRKALLEPAPQEQDSGVSEEQARHLAAKVAEVAALELKLKGQAEEHAAREEALRIQAKEFLAREAALQRQATEHAAREESLKNLATDYAAREASLRSQAQQYGPREEALKARALEAEQRAASVDRLKAELDRTLAARLTETQTWRVEKQKLEHALLREKAATEQLRLSNEEELAALGEQGADWRNAAEDRIARLQALVDLRTSELVELRARIPRTVWQRMASWF
jgi:hypothetical protein